MIPALKHLVGLLAQLVLLVVLALLAFVPISNATAQSASAAKPSPDSSNHTTPDHYWRHFVTGFAASLVAHELGHIGMSYALGAHPYVGFEGGKPTVYSGIDANLEPRKQFLFASAGLNVQSILDEAILDIPHGRGSSFERGILAGGIATAYFYATIGRNAGNSDITYMARTSSLSRAQASLIYAGIATIQTFRIARDGHYANFFMRPSATGSVSVGVAIAPER